MLEFSFNTTTLILFAMIQLKENNNLVTTEEIIEKQHSYYVSIDFDLISPEISFSFERNLFILRSLRKKNT